MGGGEDPRVTELGYGGGEFHPDTGLWDWYEDVPDAARGGARTLTWVEIFEQWPLIEATFAHEYPGVDLEDEVPRRTWRWFRVRLNHLLSTENALSRHFRAQEPPDEDD